MFADGWASWVGDNTPGRDLDQRGRLDCRHAKRVAWRVPWDKGGMATRQPLILAGFLVAILACGQDRKMIAIGPTPAKATTGALAGPLCTAESCKCAASPADAGVPEAPGAKRFEIRLGPTPHELWATLPGRVLYKSPERAEMCFYVDLAPGSHTVELRASQESGVAAAIAISELGAATQSAYATFRFSCGSPGGVCSFEELDGKKAEYKGVKENVHDPCGSTKVRELVWDTGRSPDQLVPSELAMRLVLQVYKFAPDKPHGDPSCGKGDGRRRRDQRNAGDGGGEAEAGESGEPAGGGAATPPAP